MIKDWLIRLLGGKPKSPCRHKWYVLIEHYPTYTQDYWQCGRCNFTKAYQHSEPPEPIKTKICDLAHVHIVNGKS